MPHFVYFMPDYQTDTWLILQNMEPNTSTRSLKDTKIASSFINLVATEWRMLINKPSFFVCLLSCFSILWVGTVMWASCETALAIRFPLVRYFFVPFGGVKLMGLVLGLLWFPYCAAINETRSSTVTQRVGWRDYYGYWALILFIRLGNRVSIFVKV